MNQQLFHSPAGRSVTRPSVTSPSGLPAMFRIAARCHRALPHLGGAGTTLQRFHLSNRLNTRPFASATEDPPSPAQNTAGDESRQSTAYPFTDIEQKWQQYWEENKTFRTPEDVDTSKPKYYVLDMFPYPRYALMFGPGSGSGPSARRCCTQVVIISRKPVT
jgi:hypothetical protein